MQGGFDMGEFSRVDDALWVITREEIVIIVWGMTVVGGDRFR